MPICQMTCQVVCVPLESPTMTSLRQRRAMNVQAALDAAEARVAARRLPPILIDCEGSHILDLYIARRGY